MHIFTAMFFRELVDVIVKDVNQNGVTWMDLHVSKNVATNIPDILRSSKLMDFQPTPTKQKDSLNSLILTLTEQEYQLKNISSLE